MAENRKSSRNYIFAAGIIVVIIAAISGCFGVSGQKDISFLIGYWGLGKGCESRFYEITEDSKLILRKWSGKKSGFVPDNDPKLSSVVLNDKNKITLKRAYKDGPTFEIIGQFEKISDSKFVIKNSIFTISEDQDTLKNGPKDVVYTRCEDSVKEKIRN